MQQADAAGSHRLQQLDMPQPSHAPLPGAEHQQRQEGAPLPAAAGGDCSDRILCCAKVAQNQVVGHVSLIPWRCLRAEPCRATATACGACRNVASPGDDVAAALVFQQARIDAAMQVSCAEGAGGKSRLERLIEGAGRQQLCTRQRAAVAQRAGAAQHAPHCAGHCCSTSTGWAWPGANSCLLRDRAAAGLAAERAPAPPPPQEPPLPPAEQGAAHCQSVPQAGL